MTQQSDGQHIEAVKVSSVLVDVTPELMEEPVPTGTTGDDGNTDYMPPMAWQAVLGDVLSMKREVVPGVVCCDSVVGGPTSTFAVGVTSMATPADLAGGVTVRVATPAIAGVASLADLAGGVTVRVASQADAGRPWPMLGWRPWPLLRWRPEKSVVFWTVWFKMVMMARDIGTMRNWVILVVALMRHFWPALLVLSPME